MTLSWLVELSQPQIDRINLAASACLCNYICHGVWLWMHASSFNPRPSPTRMAHYLDRPISVGRVNYTGKRFYTFAARLYGMCPKGYDNRNSGSYGWNWNLLIKWRFFVTRRWNHWILHWESWTLSVGCRFTPSFELCRCSRKCNSNFSRGNPCGNKTKHATNRCRRSNLIANIHTARNMPLFEKTA